MNSLNLNKSNIKFHDELSEMPLTQLKTEITEDIPNNYALVILDIEKVLSCIYNGIIYQEFVMDTKMCNLIQFISEGNHLIPPMIRSIDGKSWAIIDGQHRVGLALYLGIKCIPFLIRKDQIKYTDGLQ
jgi:hypothetical protein